MSLLRLSAERINVNFCVYFDFEKELVKDKRKKKVMVFILWFTHSLKQSVHFIIISAYAIGKS